MLPLLLRKVIHLLNQLDASGEAIFVDDGSYDTSVIFLRNATREDARFRLIELSRNFGHQIAITAGMDAARGEAVVVMDADLQDPPEVVLDLIGKWKEGFDIVYARRAKRHGETFFKRVTASFYYRVLAALTSADIPRDVGDFRLVGRRALDAFKSMPERDRFVRGMFAWIGFRQAEVLFHRPPRIAGETKYPFRKMARLAMHGIVGFSEKPLQAALWLGLTICLLAAGFGVYAVIAKVMGYVVADGWASTVVLISFLSGINIFMTGIVGLYVGSIHAEVKGRPLYIVAHDTFLEAASSGEKAGRIAMNKRKMYVHESEI